MGFSFGNAIAAVDDIHIRTCLKRLGLAMDGQIGTVSTLVRNNVSTSNIVAGAGLTGGGPLNAITSATLDVGAGTGITVTADAVSISSSYLGANPTGTIGITAVNGSATTYMRSDAAPAFDMTIARPWTAGVHTFSVQDVHTLGIDLSTSGIINSRVDDGPAVIGLTYKPLKALTSGTDRDLHSFQDSTGAVKFVIKADGTMEWGGRTTTGGYLNISAPVTNAIGINFGPGMSGAGALITNTGWTGNVGSYFQVRDALASTADTIVGGLFWGPGTSVQRAHARLISVLIQMPKLSAGAFNHGDMYGFYVKAASASGGALATANNIYGGYITQLLVTAAQPTTPNAYGLYIDEQKLGTTLNNGLFFANGTSGYKAIAIRDQNAWIGSSAAATLTLGGGSASGVVEVNINANVEWSYAALASTVRDGHNLVLGSTTGTKIGTATTQKLGFYDATPIVQSVNTVAINDVLVNMGLRATGGVSNFSTDVEALNVYAKYDATHYIKLVATGVAEQTILLPTGTTLSIDKAVLFKSQVASGSIAFRRSDLGTGTYGASFDLTSTTVTLNTNHDPTQVQSGLVVQQAAAGSAGSKVFQVSTNAALVPISCDQNGDLALGVSGKKIGFFNHAVAAQPSAYTPSNVSADRSYDANSTTVDELADVLGTLIADLQSLGLVA